jgi:hypothetical protein
LSRCEGIERSTPLTKQAVRGATYYSLSAELDTKGMPGAAKRKFSSRRL